jgi:hypothetical protein
MTRRSHKPFMAVSGHTGQVNEPIDTRLSRLSARKYQALLPTGPGLRILFVLNINNFKLGDDIGFGWDFWGRTTLTISILIFGFNFSFLPDFSAD